MERGLGDELTLCPLGSEARSGQDQAQAQEQFQRLHSGWIGYWAPQDVG